MGLLDHIRLLGPGRRGAAKPSKDPDDDAKKPADAEEEPEEDEEDDPAEEDDEDEDEDEEQVEARARSRITGILRASEAAGREELAQYLALETRIGAVTARNILAHAPKGDAARREGPLAQAMRALGDQANPKVGPGGWPSESRGPQTRINGMVDRLLGEGGGQ